MENTNNETGFVSAPTTTTNPPTIKISTKDEILKEIEDLKQKVVEVLKAEEVAKLAEKQNPHTIEELFKALDARLLEILAAVKNIAIFPTVFPTQPVITPNPDPYSVPWKITGPTYID